MKPLRVCRETTTRTPPVQARGWWSIGEDSLARTLLRRLGFPEESSPVAAEPENPVTKDTEPDPAVVAKDALE
jgi:hypothetical protein